jgi:hypothetical protein
MKLSSFISERGLSELEIGLTPSPATGMNPAPKPGATTLTPGQQVQQDPQAQQKMMAQQALDRANQKKQIQDAIRQKQQELADLQKQLATIK